MTTITGPDFTATISDLRALSAEAASAGDAEVAAAALLVAGLDLDTPWLQEAAAGWDDQTPWRIVGEAYATARAMADE